MVNPMSATLVVEKWVVIPVNTKFLSFYCSKKTFSHVQSNQCNYMHYVYEPIHLIFNSRFSQI